MASEKFLSLDAWVAAGGATERWKDAWHRYKQARMDAHFDWQSRTVRRYRMWEDKLLTEEEDRRLCQESWDQQIGDLKAASAKLRQELGEPVEPDIVPDAWYPGCDNRLPSPPY